MPKLAMAPPYSPIEPVSEVLHDVKITDPYRWLEDQDSPRTREWLLAQQEYARSYLDSIPGRDRIRDRIRELVDVETYDSIQKVGLRYFFRKRQPGQEQFCIYFREGAKGADQLLIDPAERSTGSYTAVKPLRVSPDGRLLLYEVKEGGERTGTFEILEIETCTALPDVLPRGYLRGFAFAPDSKSFYYVHEPLAPNRLHRAVYQHVLGAGFADDKLIFSAEEDEKLRVSLVPGTKRLGFLVCRFWNKPYTDFYLWPLGSSKEPTKLIENAGYRFGPMLLNDGRILAITDRDATNSRIVELVLRPGSEPEFVDVIPPADVPIQSLAVTQTRMLVSYVRGTKTNVRVFDLAGKSLGDLAIDGANTVRFTGSSLDEEEVLFEQEAFTKPIRTCRYSSRTGELNVWAERSLPFNAEAFSHTQVWFQAKDGTNIPMFLVGRDDVLQSGRHPAIMTSYGGYGVPMTPQFSVFVAFLMERGCLFALPNIRGGSEFGAEWHEAAKRRTSSGCVRRLHGRR